MRKITQKELQVLVPKFLTQEEYEMIIATPLNIRIGGKVILYYLSPIFLLFQTDENIILLALASLESLDIG